MINQKILAIIVAGLWLCAPVYAGVINADSLVIFGDSLSDVGNAEFYSGSIGSDYYQGRYSNGPLWIEQLADLLSFPAPAYSLGGGNDYAYGGARTGTGGFNVSLQVSDYLNTHSPNVNTLYALWAGSNDFIIDGQTDASVPVQNLIGSISQLYNAGARQFLVLNLPPLGQTPAIQALGSTVVATADFRASTFNSELTSEIDGLLALHHDLTIYHFDVWSFFNDILQSPSSYGFTNTTDPAIGLTSIDPDGYLFWDGIHPTTAAHGVLGQHVYEFLIVPEPTSLVALMGAGTLFFGYRRYG